MVTYLFLILGFVLLIKGADLFVDGSSSAAKLLRVPSVVIGLTIVAMGTSAPEAAVSITAGLAGSNEIAISNVIGSNLFNLLVVAGMSALITPFATDPTIMKRDFPLSIGAALLMLVLILDGGLSRLDGILLLVIMGSYLGYVVWSTLRDRKKAELLEQEEEIKAMSAPKSALLIVIGLAGVIWGADLVVDNACLIAESFGLSETFIGLTIIAIGTSLPELVTSITAARKGESGLALGNVVGSNLFNILFILGLSSSIHPISVASTVLVDLGIMIAVSVFFFLLGLTKKRLSRAEGIISVCLYLVYTMYLILNAAA